MRFPNLTRLKSANPFLGGRRNFALLMASLVAVLGNAGCNLFETASTTTTTQPGALSWLTNWASQPMEMAPAFDLNEIKPVLAPPFVTSGNMLEVAIWDLYEPGQPYTFPVRVSVERRIEIPLLGEVDVRDQTIPQVESFLIESFRADEYLQNPRIIVRSLDVPMIKVQLTGAVNRPGMVELSRNDRSIYAAILSAGGLSKTASAEIAVTRAPVLLKPGRTTVAKPDVNQATHVADQPGTLVDSSKEPQIRTDDPRKPMQRANFVEEFSIAPEQTDPRSMPPNSTSRGLFAVDDNAPATRSETAQRQTRPLASQTTTARDLPPSRMDEPSDRNLQPASTAVRNVGESEATITWYNITQPPDRDLLKQLILSEGDMVTVKAADLPLRIIGMVERPGQFPLLPGRSMTIWQAIDAAGGVRDPETPLNITLIRPASEGRTARRWTISMPSYTQHPAASPQVEPGDELHIAPTAGSKIKKAVRGVWSRPQ